MKTVIEMALEAGIIDFRDPLSGEYAKAVIEDLTAFSELVRADEREACAKVCEERIDFWQRDDGRRYEDEYCAGAIRARSNT